jgi:endonuclease/exonuclease/phosphatase family metal-dependent hydrolase
VKVALLGFVLLPLFADVNRMADVNLPREVRRVAGNGQAKTLRIVTWNIDHGSRLDQITEELRKTGADLCLLQEVDWNAARSGFKDVAFELAERLGMSVSYGSEFEELSQEKNGSPAYIGQATLTRLPLIKSRVLRFQRQSTFWQPHRWLPSSLPLMQRRLGSRITLVTELQFAGSLLVVYNPHLESRSMGRIQNEQLDEILADLQQHYPPGTNAAIAGDINSKYFPSQFLHKLENAGFRSALGERIERTHVIAMALDWIFVRGPFVFDEGTVQRAAKGSDHYPITALVKAQGQP